MLSNIVQSVALLIKETQLDVSVDGYIKERSKLEVIIIF